MSRKEIDDFVNFLCVDNVRKRLDVYKLFLTTKQSLLFLQNFGNRNNVMFNIKIINRNNAKSSIH